MMGTMHERPEDSLPSAVPARKSNYELPNKKNTSLRNILWALGLTMIIVLVVGFAFFGVGGTADQEIPENSQLDVAASAERAEAAAGFPIAVPELDQQWQERSARFHDGEEPRWQIDYTSPAGSLVTMVESPQVSPAMLASAVPGATVEEELEIAGAPCQVLRGSSDGGAQRGVACEGESWGFVAHGAGEPAELEELATAAIASLG